MPEIDLGKMTDRELLIVTATTVNGMSVKLDTFCLKVDSLEGQFSTLKAEHDLRTQGDCLPNTTRSKKELAASGGIGGLIVGGLVLLVEYLVRTFKS